MAFKVKTKVDQRLEFVLMAMQKGANVRALCRRFGISPDTGYRLLRRYREAGREGLADRSRRPVTSPRRTPPAVEAEVVALRTAQPTWAAARSPPAWKAWGWRRPPPRARSPASCAGTD